MLHKGFEWALQHGEPLNLPPLRYKWHQPCCELQLSGERLTCAHPWNVTAEFPRGDVRGGPWKGPHPDPGTFEGGSQWEGAQAGA